MKKIKAFILAAGYGERLRPITDHIPKPLLPICGKPVIEIVFERLLSSIELQAIGINCHHKSEQIERWANNLLSPCNLSIFSEPAILGTGGALKNAESFLNDSIFIVHNSDILSDMDLMNLVSIHAGSGNIATLAVHQIEKFSNVWTDSYGNVKAIGKAIEKDSGLCKTAFMGIAVYSGTIFNFIPSGSSSVVDAWIKAIHAGHRVGTADFTGCYWNDIGTPDAYAEAVFDQVAKNGETIYIHKTADCSKAELGGNVAIEEGASINVPVHIKNSILLPRTSISSCTDINSAIVGPEFSVALDNNRRLEPIKLSPAISEWFGFKEGPAYAENIGTGGSDRRYYRICADNRKAVLMKCTESDPDFDRHIAYTHFFGKYLVPVPELIMIDSENKQALFEDIGDISLYSWLRCRREDQEVRYIYKKILDMTVQIQTALYQNVSECRMLKQRVFDYEHLRWETDYFMEWYVKIRMNTKNISAELYNEFDRLAVKVSGFPKTLVHRDFQSQNIMITAGCIPRLIDYQGARIGPAAYDIASMLWDPYYRLGERLREDLVGYYILTMKQALPTFNEYEFYESLIPCRLQRHMQALGAYGFLSAKKGKAYFLKHAPTAIEYLKKEAEAAKKDYPALHELIIHI